MGGRGGGGGRPANRALPCAPPLNRPTRQIRAARRTAIAPQIRHMAAQRIPDHGTCKFTRPHPASPESYRHRFRHRVIESSENFPGPALARRESGASGCQGSLPASLWPKRPSAEIIQVPNVNQGVYGGPTHERDGYVPMVRGSTTKTAASWSSSTGTPTWAMLGSGRTTPATRSSIRPTPTRWALTLSSTR